MDVDGNDESHARSHAFRHPTRASTFVSIVANVGFERSTSKLAMRKASFRRPFPDPHPILVRVATSPRVRRRTLRSARKEAFFQARMKRKAHSQVSLMTHGGYISDYRVEGSTLVPHWTCNFCGRAFKGQLNRARAHILQLTGRGIVVCDHAVKALEPDQRRELESEGHDVGLGCGGTAPAGSSRGLETGDERRVRALANRLRHESATMVPNMVPGFPFGEFRCGGPEVRIWVDFCSPASKKLFFLLLDSVLPLYHEKADFIFQIQVQPWYALSAIAHEVVLAAFRAGGIDLFWKAARAMFGAMNRLNDEQAFDKSRNELVRTLASTIGSSMEEVNVMLRYLLLPTDGGDALARESLMEDLKCHILYGHQLCIHTCPAVVVNGLQVDMGGSWNLTKMQKLLEPLLG